MRDRLSTTAKENRLSTTGEAATVQPCGKTRAVVPSTPNPSRERRGGRHGCPGQFLLSRRNAPAPSSTGGSRPVNPGAAEQWPSLAVDPVASRSPGKSLGHALVLSSASYRCLLQAAGETLFLGPILAQNFWLKMMIGSSCKYSANLTKTRGLPINNSEFP